MGSYLRKNWNRRIHTDIAFFTSSFQSGSQNPPDRLKWASVEIVSDAECRGKYGPYFKNNSMICAGGGVSSAALRMIQFFFFIYDFL